MIRIIVSAIIEKNGKFLIVKQGEGEHHSGLWAFPGGKLKLDESIPKGLIRELKEETSLDVSMREISHALLYKEDNVLVLFIKCDISSDEVQAGSDVSDFKWVDLSELEQLPTRPMMNEIINYLRINNFKNSLNS